MKTLYKTCLLMALVMMGLVWLSEQQAFCAEQDSSNRVQRGRRGRRNVWSFEEEKTGSIPQGWKVAETRGKGTPATWQVVEDSTAPSASNVVSITANKNRGSTY